MEPTDTASLHAQIANLKEELDSLRARYDTLLEAKNRAAERYKADYKKWRDFKRWLFRDAETDSHVKARPKSGELAAYMETSALGKRKLFEGLGPNVDAEVDHEAEDPKQESMKVELHSPPVVAPSRHQRRKSYHGESSNKVLSPSPGTNQDPFLVPLFTNCDDKPLALDHMSGKLPSSFKTSMG